MLKSSVAVIWVGNQTKCSMFVVFHSTGIVNLISHSPAQHNDRDLPVLPLVRISQILILMTKYSDLMKFTECFLLWQVFIFCHIQKNYSLNLNGLLTIFFL